METARAAARIGDSWQSLVKQERTRVYSIVPRKGSSHDALLDGNALR